MANCGPRFHAVIGRFKFLNELIKLVSNKVRACEEIFAEQALPSAHSSPLHIAIPRLVPIPNGPQRSAIQSCSRITYGANTTELGRGVKGRCRGRECPPPPRVSAVSSHF